MIYYRFHIGDYLRDTAHLTMIEHGAYRILLDLYYQHSRPLPGTLNEVMRLARCRNKHEQSAVERVLKEFFTLTTDGYTNHRCNEEIELMMKKSEKARQKAKRRWNAVALPQQCQGNASRYPLSNKGVAFDLKTSPSELKTHDEIEQEKNRVRVALRAKGIEI